MNYSKQADTIQNKHTETLAFVPTFPHPWKTGPYASAGSLHPGVRKGWSG